MNVKDNNRIPLIHHSPFMTSYVLFYLKSGQKDNKRDDHNLSQRFLKTNPMYIWIKVGLQVAFLSKIGKICPNCKNASSFDYLTN